MVHTLAPGKKQSAFFFFLFNGGFILILLVHYRHPLDGSVITQLTENKKTLQAELLSFTWNHGYYAVNVRAKNKLDY